MLSSALILFVIGTIITLVGFSYGKESHIADAILALLCFVPAVILLLNSIRLSRGRWSLLYNPKNGAMLRRLLLFNRVLRHHAIIPVEAVHFPASRFDGQAYPISTAALRDGNQSGSVAKIYCATIADLAARGLLSVWRARSVTQDKEEFVIVPGPARPSEPISGMLERSLIHIVNHWPDYLLADNPQINEQVGPTVFMLVYLTLRNPTPQPRMALRAVQPVDTREIQMLQDEAAAYADQVEQMNPHFVTALQDTVRHALVALTYVAPTASRAGEAAGMKQI